MFDKIKCRFVWFLVFGSALNLATAIIFYPLGITALNFIFAGWLGGVAATTIVEARIHRAKDKLIETLERNQDQFARFLDDLAQVGTVEMTVERTDKPPSSQVH